MSNIYNHDNKKIIHIDMDSFFASVEIRDNPTLAKQPVAVGGHPNTRGVIATSNYIARKYGVHSAMSTAKALTLCPKLVVIYPNIEKYRVVSNSIMNIFHSFTEQVEPLSLDEAFLDVTNCSACGGSATLIAMQIKQIICQQERLVASAGVAANKFLAKVASDWNKPNGLFVITPDQVENFVRDLPVKKIPGVGVVMAARLGKLGVYTCAQLQEFSLIKLQKMFGKVGSRLYYFARGNDTREVEISRVRKSLSVEETFAKDILTPALCVAQIPLLAKELELRLAKTQHKPIVKLFVKIKFANFVSTTVEKTHNCIDLTMLQQLLATGLERYPALPVRLLGIGVRFVEKNYEQLSLPEIC